MNNEPIPLLVALEAITNAHAEYGDHPPQPLPVTLNRKQISTMVSVFQTKERDGRWAEDEAHVKTLRSLIGKADNPHYLDPVTVWRGGDRWYLLDGHRRLAAYRMAGVNTGIPVAVFEGTLDDARAHSVALNSKDQMPMTTADKMNCAWKLSLTTGLSRSRLMKACSVAKGSIDNIRVVKAKLMEEREMTVAELTEMSWEQARLEADDRETTAEFDPDETLKKNAEYIRRRVMQAVGGRIARDPDAFAVAISSIDSRLPGKLMQSNAWWSPLRQTIEDLKYQIGEDAETILEALPEDPEADDAY